MQIFPESDEEWEDRERLQGERDTLGLYLTGHPIDRYSVELANVITSRIGKLLLPEEERRYGGRQRAVVAGLVVGVRHSQRQCGRIGNLALDDDWRVHPNEELQHRLERFLGLDQVAADYDRRRAAGTRVASLVFKPS
jgi:DNA polymerase III alpha subunit